MYNKKDIQFVGKHDYDKESAEKFASNSDFKTFSINIFQWILKSNGKEMKQGKCIVRVTSPVALKGNAFAFAELVVKDLDDNVWDGRKNVLIK